MDTSSSTNNPYNSNVFEQCIRNSEEDDGLELMKLILVYRARQQNIYLKFVSFYLTKLYGHNYFVMYF